MFDLEPLVAKVHRRFMDVIACIDPTSSAWSQPLGPIPPSPPLIEPFDPTPIEPRAVQAWDITIEGGVIVLVDSAIGMFRLAPLYGLFALPNGRAVADLVRGELRLLPFARYDKRCHGKYQSVKHGGLIHVHRIVCNAFHGAPPEDIPDDELVVRHLNDNGDDNRASNLAWGTKAENARDRVRNGRHRSRAKHTTSTFTEVEKADIVACARRGASARSICLDFRRRGIKSDPKTVLNIIKAAGIEVGRTHSGGRRKTFAPLAGHRGPRLFE